MEKPMTTRVLWASVVTLGIASLLLVILIGSVQFFSVDDLSDYFLADQFRRDPPIVELKWSLFDVIGAAVGAAGVLSIVWVLIVSFGRDILAPGYARKRRPMWWACLILGAASAGVAGYLLSDLPWLAGDVPPQIGAGCAVIFLLGYWLATVFSTPFMVRSGVPFGNLVAGQIRFP